MEPMSAVELFKNAPKHGIKYSTYTGDDDSTTELYMNQQVPYGVEKFSDIYTLNVHSQQGCITSARWHSSRIVLHCPQKLFNI